MADGGKGDAEDAPLLLHASWGGGGAAASPTVAASQASAAPTGGTPAFSPLSVQPSSRSEAGMQAGTCQLLARTGTSSGFGVGAGTSSGFGVGAARALHAPTSHWGITSALLLADMFGIGSLALPGVFARLGWLLSFVLMGAFCLGCGYLGVLFTKLAVAQPTATTMDELGSAALGKMGKRLVFGAFYTTIIVDPIALHITSMLALQQVIPGLSTLAASAIIAIVMLPLAQIQSVHDAAWLSLLATGCMMGATCTTLIKLLSMPGSQGATSLLPPSETRAIEGLIAALSMCFAFGGQVNWMRWVSGMAHRSEFKWAVELCDGIMTCFYILLACTAYHKLGDSFDASLPITSVLPRDGWTRFINLLLLVRCLVAYTLNANVFSDLALRLGKGWLDRVEDACPRLGRRASWGLCSVGCIAMSFLVAWAVPAFDLVIAVIASIGDVLAPYTLPALFALVLLPDLPRLERWLLRMIVPVSALFAAAGLYASGYRLVEVLGS